MEFLVHNISHSDLIVELSWVRDAASNDHTETTNPPSNSSANGHKKKPSHSHVMTADGASVPLSLLGRPKFNLFQQTSQAIMDTVVELLRAAPPGGIDSTLLSTACEPEDATAGGVDNESPTTRALHPSMLDIAPAQQHQHTGRRWKAARCHDTQSPVGFKLDGHPIPVLNLHDFQIRGAFILFYFILFVFVCLDIVLCERLQLVNFLKYPNMHMFN